MAQYNKSDVIKRAQELAKMIAETEEVDFFKRAEAQLNENQKVRETIASIKSLQKQAVNFQHYGKTEALKQVEAKSIVYRKSWMNCRLFSSFKSLK